jgi:bifunctional non-homologous end joining protein LigD
MTSPLDELVERFGDVENATLVEQPPPGEYAYELKYDGYRILAFKVGSRVRLVSRRGQDWTDDFSEVAATIAQLTPAELVLDGEVVAVDERGIPSFQRLQHRQRPLVYVMFDVLHLEGRDLRAQPLEKRRAALEQVVGRAAPPLGLSRAVSGDVRQLLKAACSAGFEGLIGKRAGSAYVPGRGFDWIKLKCQLRQEFAIAGYVPYTGNQLGVVGGLLLALRQGDKFVFSGKVGTGFDQKTRAELGQLLEKRWTAKSPVVGIPKFGGLPRFCTLGPVAEVKFTEWTEGGNVRHPSFVGLRPDKRPEDCVHEGTPEVASPAQAAKLPAPVRGSKNSRPDVAGVSISNATRRLDPLPLTKLELARYYEQVGDVMLPHVIGRPLTLLRWAEGKATTKGGVFLRHTKAWGPAVLRRVQIPEQKKVGEYLVVTGVSGLVALAQMDIVEIHSWNSTESDIEHPDRVVFDLDPGPDVDWDLVVDSAHALRAALQGIGLESWLKTTGGKGLHLVVPLIPEHDWDTCLATTREIARQFAASDPKRYVASLLSKTARHKKIFIDYLRNNRASTSVAAYSTRSNPEATVSTPLHWDELRRLRNERFTVQSVLHRVAALKADPWADYWGAKQRLFGGVSR